MNVNIASSKLILKNLTLSIHLGHTAQEREQLQPIVLNAIIKFHKLPLACETDQLTDSVCYKELSEAISEFCASKQFNLLEYLGYQLYKFIKDKLPQNISLWLSIAKITPIANLENSIFSIGDWEN
jgi:dihydroneopterin aldolase